VITLAKQPRFEEEHTQKKTSIHTSMTLWLLTPNGAGGKISLFSGKEN